jgi:hypothetical protein
MISQMYFEAPLPALGTEVTSLIVENTSAVVTYAFSQAALAALYDSNAFHGSFRAVERAFFDVPKRKATRAVIELALMYRALDDTPGLSSSLREFESGTLISGTGTSKPLRFRDMLNKIIHAKEINWTFEDLHDPMLECHAPQVQMDKFDWSRADIPVKCLGQACSWLAVP